MAGHAVNSEKRVQQRDAPGQESTYCHDITSATALRWSGSSGEEIDSSAK